MKICISYIITYNERVLLILIEKKMPRVLITLACNPRSECSMNVKDRCSFEKENSIQVKQKKNNPRFSMFPEHTNDIRNYT